MQLIGLFIPLDTLTKKPPSAISLREFTDAICKSIHELREIDLILPLVAELSSYNAPDFRCQSALINERIARMIRAPRWQAP